MNKQQNTTELLEALCDELDPNTELSSESMNEIPTVSETASSSETAETAETAASVRYTETRLSEDAVDNLDGWLDNEHLQHIDNKHVIAQLDEIILLLIATRGEASGKELCQDLQRLFGADLSPGTVYPCLTDLTESGYLNMRELARRKVYDVADREIIADQVAPEVDQLLTVSIVLKLLTMELTPNTTFTERGSE